MNTVENRTGLSSQAWFLGIASVQELEENVFSPACYAGAAFWRSGHPASDVWAVDLCSCSSSNPNPDLHVGQLRCYLQVTFSVAFLVDLPGIACSATRRVLSLKVFLPVALLNSKRKLFSPPKCF